MAEKLYIDEADYATYNGEDIDDFERYAKRACEAVDIATNYRLTKLWPNMLSEGVQRRVKLACCAQAEFLYMNGIETALDGAAEAGYQIGKTSSLQGTRQKQTSNPGGLCAMACRTLARTGLLYTGVPIVW